MGCQRTLWNKPSSPGMLVAGEGRGFTAYVRGSAASAGALIAHQHTGMNMKSRHEHPPG